MSSIIWQAILGWNLENKITEENKKTKYFIIWDSKHLQLVIGQ